MRRSGAPRSMASSAPSRRPRRSVALPATLSIAGLAADRGPSLADALGITIVELTTERVVATMPVDNRTRQPYGILHGGATAALCETVASVGTAVAVGMEKRVLGIELNVNHIRAAREGFVTATGVPLHVGRTTAVWDVKVRDDQGRLTAAGRLTLTIRESRND